MVLENVLVFMSYVRFLNDASRIDKYVCSISIKWLIIYKLSLLNIFKTVFSKRALAEWSLSMKNTTK